MKSILVGLLVASVVWLAGCGGGGTNQGSAPQIPNPVPSIANLSPASANAGAPSQAVTITGSNFLANSTVTYNAVLHAAVFVNSTQLTISLTASDQATTGTYSVVVTNPTPGGGASNSVVFTVKPPPTITSISVSCSPASIAGGQTSQCLATVSGTGEYSTGVSWGVTAGAISASGLFTGPSSAGSVTVTATSTEDSTKNATTTITITSWSTFTDSQLQIEVAIPPFGQPTQSVVTNPVSDQTKVEIQVWDPTEQQFFPQFELIIYSTAAGTNLQNWFEGNVDINGILAANNTFASQQLGNGQAALVRQFSIPQGYAELNGPVDEAYVLSPTTGRVLGIAQSQVTTLFNMGYTQQSITNLMIQILGSTQF